MVHAATAFAQLACLSAFGAGVWWLNQQAPRRVSQRVFKLSWLLPTVAAGWLFFWLASTAFINAPTRLQTTNAALITAHDSIRATCQNHLDNLRYDDAYSTISVRTKTSELVGEHARKLSEMKQHKSSLARMMQPILNSLLFHTGVTIVFVPALLRLLLLLWKIQRQGANANDPKFVESVRREWGVFLPIMNVVTLLSLCVSPTFYFFIEPGRAARCVYSSGHWYTFTCTLLTFAIVLTHLYRNRDYCKSCMRLLNYYFVWLVLYLAMSLMVLKTTQTFFHDSLEARDGIRQALPSFLVFMLILISFQFLTRNKRDITEEIEAAKQGKQVAQDNEEEEEEEEVAASTTTKRGSTKKQSAARSSNKISSPAHDEGEEDEQPASKPRSSSRKKAAAATHLPKSPSEASFEFVEPEAEATPPAAAAPPAPAVASAVPNAPPAAPPMAPPPPSAPSAPSSSSSGRTDIKITKSAAKPKAAAGPDTDALLKEIQGGKRLKKVIPGSASSSSAPKPPPANDLMSQLRAQLAAVRVGVDGEKDEGAEADW